MALFAASCTPVPVRTGNSDFEAAQDAHEQALAASTDWSFRGRIALSVGGRADSGRIEWRQRGEDFDIRLSAPITGQSWRLRQEAGQVRLDGLEGGTRTGADAESLLLEATGWRIPLAALRAWVRGGRAKGPAQLDFDPVGRPATLGQQGWVVEYRGWDRENLWPRKVHARTEGASVRLVVDAWGVP